MNDIELSAHQIRRVRREVRRRLVRVSAVEQVTSKMRRVHFASPELHDFESAGADDHVKLFVPNPAATRSDEAWAMRDYTPRRFDVARGTLAIDFALHDSGPATAWALSAKPGDEIQIGGPRGSTIVPDDFDWYLLIGDETALPSIGRRLESLRAGVPVRTLIVVESAAERQAIATEAAWAPTWVTRTAGGTDDTELLLASLAATGPLPEGDGYIWIAGEARVARALRAYVIENLGHPKAWLKTAGYWMVGQADAHINIED